MANNVMQNPNNPQVPNENEIVDVPTPANAYLLPNESVPQSQQSFDGQTPMVIPVGGAPAVSFAPQPTQRAPANQPVNPAEYAQQPVAVPQPAAQVALPKEATASLATYGTQQKANQAIANAAAQKATLDEMAQAELQDKMAQQEAKRQEMQAQFDSTFKDRTAHIDDVSKKLASQEFTTAKVDNNHLWSSMSTGQKILGGIAMALSGLGAGVTGKQNLAIDVINKAIDRDIEAQKVNIQSDMESKKAKSQNFRDQLGAETSMLSNLRQKYGDDMQAESALRGLMIQQTQLKLQQIASNTESKTIKSNAEYANASLEREKQTAAQALKAQVAQQAILNNLGGQGWQNLSPAQQAMVPKAIREQYEKQAEVSPPSGSDWVGQAPNKELLNKFVETQGKLQPSIDGLKRVMALSDDLNRVTDLSKKAKIKSEIIALTGAMREAIVGPGAMQPAEYKRLLEVVGDPTELTSIPKLQQVRLKQIMGKFENDLEAAAKASGFRKRPQITVPMRPYGK